MQTINLLFYSNFIWKKTTLSCPFLPTADLPKEVIYHKH